MTTVMTRRPVNMRCIEHLLVLPPLVHEWGGTGLGTGKWAEWLTSLSLFMAHKFQWIDGEWGNWGG